MRNALFLGLMACAPGADITAATLPSSGYRTLEIDTAPLGLDARQVTDAHVGGIRALIEATPDPDTLRLLVQGHPTPGTYDLVLEREDAHFTIPAAVTYLPADPALGRIVAIGASVTMGFRGGAFEGDAALTSPAALVAHTLGAWFPVPLTKPDVLFEADPSRIEPPRCPALNYRDHFGEILASRSEALANPDAPGILMGRARRDPDLAPHNLAVAATAIAELFNGVNRATIAKRVYSQLVHAPREPFDGGVGEPQLDVLDRLAPDVVLGFDLLANDIVDAILDPAGIDASLARDFSLVEPALATVLDRLEATGAEIFLATMPALSRVPLTHDAAQRSRDRGVSEAEIEAELAAIDAMVSRANATLIAQVAERPRFHLVDIAAAVDDLPSVSEGFGLPPFTTDRYAGIMGVDGIHFTQTGNAIAAALTIEAIAEVLGIESAAPDFERIYASDREQPAALRDRGLPDACLP